MGIKVSMNKFDIPGIKHRGERNMQQAIERAVKNFILYKAVQDPVGMLNMLNLLHVLTQREENTLVSLIDTIGMLRKVTKS